MNGPPALARAPTALGAVAGPRRSRCLWADPAALAALRALDHALRNQREDRHRADALLALIGDLLEDYADGPSGDR
ncbi:hypothetical protein QFZ82_006793 [Streptomyces sp. V4I23]|uniref:hypothetical protein n=1 Tax=Streptomyces sp. V4I23 TaxID=3042282 RepID=UPI00278719AC|nr:hypothetical protein [Streptomyces sp. V4I23]MDQ1012308.1 hypothetical protein [Streptomyces sp. V4I23]